MSLIYKMINFATKAHDGQFRKYNKLPYIVHPFRVMNRIQEVGHYNENLLCAALAHDLPEETSVTFDDLNKEFNEEISHLVWEMTQPDDLDENIKKLPRIERHKLHVEKLINVSKCAKIIKLSDRLDNLCDSNPIENSECYGFFKRRYLQESWDVLHAVEDGCANLAVTLEQRIKDLAEDCKVELK